MPAPKSTCPPEGVLSDLLADSLPVDQLALLNAHIAACAACQTELDRLSGTATPVPAARGPAPPDSALAALVDRLAAPTWFGRPAGDPPCPEWIGGYRIDGELGRGGMGVVYRAFDLTLGRPVALKRVLEMTRGGPPDPRFLREAQAVARVRHDHIVVLHAVHAPPDDAPVMVMEFVDGDSLRDQLARQTVFPPRAAAGLCAQVADGLAAAHAGGVIHRDVKPSNILVERTTGRAKLADFGLARTTAAARLSRDGALVGTPAYMSPEQVTDPARADARADVYGLGATLYELLTGTEPFRGPVEQVLRQVVADEPVAPRRLHPSVPRDLETICLTALAKNPARRYQSAAALRDDLRRWLAGEPIVARPVGPVGRGWRWCRRNPRVAVLGGLVFGLVLAVVVGSVVAAGYLARAYDRAETAREAADTARADAEAARAQAERDARTAATDFELAYQALDALIVTTQRQLDTRPGMLPIKRQLLETAAAGLARLVHPPADAGRVDRLVVAARDRLGDVYFDLGRTAEAREAYASGLRAAGSWVTREPDNPDAGRALAGAHDKLGTQAGFARDAAAAADHYRQAAAIRRQLADRFPAHRGIRRDWSISLHKLGDVALAAGDPAAARERYAASLQIVEALPPGPDPAERWIDVRFRNTRLCDACLALDDLNAAERHALAAAAAARELARTDPADGRREMAASLERAAQVALQRGDPESAVKLRREVLAARREILAADRMNQEANRNVSAAHWLLGQALVTARDLPGARAEYEISRGMSELAAATDPGSLQKGTDVVLCYRELAVVEMAAGRFKDAAVWAEKCAAICRLAEGNQAAAHLQPKYWRARYERERDVFLAAARVGLTDPGRFEVEPGPVKVGLWELRSVCLGWQGRANAAADAAAELRKLAPDDPDALLAAAQGFAFAAGESAGPARERYALAAMDALAALIRARPEAREGLAQLPAFIVLRTYPSYHKLVRSP